MCLCCMSHVRVLSHSRAVLPSISIPYACCHLRPPVVTCCHLLSPAVACCHLLSPVVACCRLLSSAVVCSQQRPTGPRRAPQAAQHLHHTSGGQPQPGGGASRRHQPGHGEEGGTGGGAGAGKQGSPARSNPGLLGVMAKSAGGCLGISCGARGIRPPPRGRSWHGQKGPEGPPPGCQEHCRLLVPSAKNALAYTHFPAKRRKCMFLWGWGADFRELSPWWLRAATGRQYLWASTTVQLGWDKVPCIQE